MVSTAVVLYMNVVIIVTVSNKMLNNDIGLIHRYHYFDNEINYIHQ